MCALVTGVQTCALPISEAGVEGLTLDFLLTAGDSIHDQIGVIVKDQLGKVGVGVNLIKQEEGQHWESKIERATSRERVGLDVYIAVGAGKLKKKNKIRRNQYKYLEQHSNNHTNT